MQATGGMSLSTASPLCRDSPLFATTKDVGVRLRRATGHGSRALGASPCKPATPQPLRLSSRSFGSPGMHPRIQHAKQESRKTSVLAPSTHSGPIVSVGGGVAQGLQSTAPKSIPCAALGAWMLAHTLLRPPVRRGHPPRLGKKLLITALS